MNAEAALIASAALLLFALWTGREPSGLPKMERLWFHLSITWPVAVKAALGSLIFGQAMDEGTNYALVTYGPAAFIASALFFQRLKLNAKVFTPGLILVTLLVLSLPFVAQSGAGITGLLPLVMALPVVLCRLEPVPVVAWLAQARVSLFVLAVSLLAVALTVRMNVIGFCRLDKCSVFGEVLTSPITNNGNFAGVAVAILLPWALLGVRKFPMLLVASASLLLIELSGSRSAALAAWVVVAAVVLGSGNWGKRAWVGWFAFFGALVGSVVTAVGEFPADFATWRGGLWARAQELFGESPFIGAGPSRWVQQPLEIGFIANYSPHNIWLEFAVAGGVVALLAAVVAMVALLRGVPKQERNVFVLAFTALLALGILESPVQPGRIGLAPFAHLLPLMAAAAGAVAKRNQVIRSPHQAALAGRSPALR